MLLKVYDNATSPKDLALVADHLRSGGLMIYPTDTVYSIGCDALNSKALQKLAQIKGINPKHAHFSILCSDLSQVSTYVKLDDQAFAFIKEHTPGPYTFILPVGSGLPRIYKERKEVGVRIPNHPFVKVLIDYYDSPLTGFSLPPLAEGVDEAYEYHPELIHEMWENKVHLVIDGGIGVNTPSTVIDCTEDDYVIIREGKM